MIDPNTPNHKLFGKNADARLATELYNTDKPDYYRRRAQVEKDGLLAPKPVWTDPDYRKRFDPKQFTEDELNILAQIPEDVTTHYYRSPSSGGSDTLGNLAANPDKQDYYNKVRAAAMLRGLIPSAPIAPQPEPKPASPFVTVPDADCDRAGLPHGYKTTSAGLETVKRVIADVEAKRADAERLAATTAEKLARDAAVDESVAQFGRLLEINREIDAKQRERDAAEKAVAG
jgi:hypothetical protein